MSTSLLPPVLEKLYINLTTANGKSVTEISRELGRTDDTTPMAGQRKDQNGTNSEPDPQSQQDQPQSGTSQKDPVAPKDAQTTQAGDKTNAPLKNPEQRPIEPVANKRIPKSVPDPIIPDRAPVNIFAVAVLGLIAGAGVGSALLRAIDNLGLKWEKMAAGDRITVFIGSFVGVIVGIIVSLPFQVAFQGKPEGALVTLGLIVGCGAASVYILRTMSDVLPWETTVQPKKRSGLKILDTNVLIDGRAYDLMRTGFLEGEIYIPNFVLLELQHIADSADALRRQRGRRGLDVLKRIQSEFDVTVGEHDKYAGNEKDEVDSRLVKLALSLGADLVSNDFNLNKVATIQNVRVLNINELALSLRPTILPGEPLEVSVVKEGSQFGQGVGYLDDGTMVVVEHGAHLIGTTTAVSVTQVIQTERGKMIFADAENNEDDDTKQNGKRTPRK